MVQVIEDCDKALAINPDFSKACFRKGKALAALVRLLAARPASIDRGKGGGGCCCWTGL